jgi:microcystin-dependent protein
MMFAGDFAPKGFALCQGQLLAIAQNTALFSILGTTYGGDGRVTFALPDLRGRGPVQQGTGQGLPTVVLGEMAGNTNVTLLLSNLPQHNHTLNGNNAGSGTNLPGSTVVPSNGGDANTPVNLYSTGNPSVTLSPSAITATGNNQPVNIQNPYLGINFIIALQGIFPSRN